MSSGAMPWDRVELQGWAISGMNHYNLSGKRHLYVSMAKDIAFGGRVARITITAEGEDEGIVFNDLAQDAQTYARESKSFLKGGDEAMKEGRWPR